jgi:transcriptional regulator with XRE-family HTH domain
MQGINIIQDLRERLNLNQEELAVKLGLSREMVNKMEKGKLNVSAKTKLTIREKFGIDYVNKVSHETDTKGNTYEQTDMNTYVNDGAVDRTEELIRTLKKQVKLLEEKCAKMENELKESKALQVSLDAIAASQRLLQAQVKAASQRAAFHRFGTDKKKVLQEMEEINKLIGAELK